MLVRVARDDEAGVRAIGGRLRASFHFARILDAGLVLGGQGKGGPFLGVLHRARTVVIEAHLHLDHPLERRGIPPFVARTLLHRRNERVAVELGAFSAGDDDPVAVAAGEGGGLWAAGRDEQRDRVARLVEKLRLLRAEVLPLEGHVVLRPELLDEADGLAESSQPLPGLGPLGRRERRFVHGLAAAHAQEHAPRGEKRDRGHGLRDDRGVVAERRRHHARAKPHPRSARGHRAEPRERERRVPAGVAPGVEVIAHRDAVEAELLGEHGVIEERLGVELFRRRFPAER